VESYAASVSQVGNVRCTATSGPDVGIMLIIFLKGTGRLDRSLASTVLCILMTHPAGDMHINKSDEIEAQIKDHISLVHLLETFQQYSCN
jgi:hypothetical protein